MRAGGLVLGVWFALGCSAHVTTPAPREGKGMTTSPDGIPIAYEFRGTGLPALVFVHGWSCDRTFWAGQVDPFSKTSTVVALDLAGHGESGKGRAEWTIEAFGGDVAAVVDALALPRVVLIGHSMGGDATVEAARRLRGRVAGQVWVDVYRELGPGRSPEAVEALIAPLRADFVGATRRLVRGFFPPNADPALVDRVVTKMSSAPPEIAIDSLFHSFSHSREVVQAMAELDAPVVAINSDLFPTNVESMKRGGMKQVVVMPGVGHFLQMEDPERFNRLLAGVVASMGP